MRLGYQDLSRLLRAFCSLMTIGGNMTRGYAIARCMQCAPVGRKKKKCSLQFWKKIEIAILPLTFHPSSANFCKVNGNFVIIDIQSP